MAVCSIAGRVCLASLDFVGWLVFTLGLIQFGDSNLEPEAYSGPNINFSALWMALVFTWGLDFVRCATILSFAPLQKLCRYFCEK